MRGLVVEDERTLAEGLRRGLEAEGFAADVAHDGTDGLHMALEHVYDAIVLDIMLPRVNGYEVCRRIRERELDMPIIMLTAKGDEVDRILGLEMGADDYLPKPFNPRELVARIHAIVRRSKGHAQSVINTGDLVVNPTPRRWE